MKHNLIIGAVAIVAFGLGYLVSSLQSTTDLSNGLTLDGFPVRGEIRGYYTTREKEGAEGNIQTCDVLVATGGDDRLIERYKAAAYTTNEAGQILINLNLSNIDPVTRKAIIASSPSKILTVTITDFEEIGFGTGQCFSHLDGIKLK